MTLVTVLCVSKYKKKKKNQEKLFKPFLQTGRLDCCFLFLVLKTFFFVPKYDKILSDRLCWCLALLTEIRIVKKSWRAGLVVCNPAQFLRGIFSGQMNTTLPKIEGRPLCSVVLSACYHTAPMWWAETDNHLCRSESSRKWRRTKLCWKRPGCFLLLCLLKWVRERREMKTSSDVAAQTCKRFCVCLMMVSISGHSCSVADNIFFCCWDMLFFPVFSLVCTEVGHTHTRF